jgi:hypothetical protein
MNSRKAVSIHNVPLIKKYVRGFAILINIIFSRKRIYIKLSGGLGNQMFQYALGRSLAVKNKAELYLDNSELLYNDASLTYVYRKFELDIFNVGYKFGSPAPPPPIFHSLTNYFSPIQFVHEENYAFHPSILALKGNVYLEGFWQSENYFKDIEPVIRHDFTFKMNPDSNNSELISQIKSTDSISIHFRRGDYITNEAASKVHGVCSEQYYISAIQRMKAAVETPHFYIFSDDINWVAENFSIEAPHTYVTINQEGNNFEDLRLMSLCKHNIIANSSFSWWGAWLNENKSKIVIAPKQWYLEKYSEIVPPQWVKL